jgi:flagellar basal body rod protein FlgG
MPYGLYISAEGARVQAARLQVIANNLANADTVGFKPDVLQIQARHAEAIEQGLDYPGSRSINDLGGGVTPAATATDLRPAAVEVTGRPTDVAIRGEGFFVVQRDGQNYLTRAGRFEIGAGGLLQTVDGYPVLSAQGTPIVLDPAQGVQITSDGRVQQAGAAIPLALVRPQQPGDLAKAGGGLFLPLAEVVPLPAAQRQVEPYALERSGVNQVQEMLEMIETTRAFESNVHMIQNQDHMLGTLIGRLLAVRS